MHAVIIEEALSEYRAEASRAVAYLAHKGDIPIDARSMLTEHTRRATEAIVRPLLREHLPSDEREASRAGGSVLRLADAGESMARIDAALARYVEALGDTTRAKKIREGSIEAYKRADDDDTTYNTAWDWLGPVHEKWRTHRKDGLFYPVVGESWPPDFRFGGIPVDEQGETVPRFRELAEALWNEHVSDSAIEEGDTDTTETLRHLRASGRFAEAMRNAMRADEAFMREWEPSVRLVRLATALWEYGSVREQWNAPTFSLSALPSVRSGGERYAGLPKTAAATAWALGSVGEQLTDIDGDRYSDAPGAALTQGTRLVRYRPKVVGVTTSGPPAQRSMAIQRNVDVSRDALHVLSPSAGRSYIVLSAMLPTEQAIIEAPLDELARWLNQHKGRYRRERDLPREARALWELRSLSAILDDDGVEQLVNVTAPQDPDNPNPDMVVRFSLTRVAEHVISATGGAGEVLINVDGLLRIPLLQSHIMRTYIQAGRHWNDGRMDGRTAAWVADLDTVRAQINEVEQTTRDATARAARRDKRNKVREAIDYLHDEGLAVVEKKSRRINAEYVIRPTEAHEEAYRIRRAGGQRQK